MSMTIGELHINQKVLWLGKPCVIKLIDGYTNMLVVDSEDGHKGLEVLLKDITINEI